jgi:hypothetical protein
MKPFSRLFICWALFISAAHAFCNDKRTVVDPTLLLNEDYDFEKNIKLDLVPEKPWSGNDAKSSYYKDVMAHAPLFNGQPWRYFL